jgi:RNA polymerase sigma factor (sigma-70 family)
MDRRTSDEVLGNDRDQPPDWGRAYEACSGAMYRKARSQLRGWDVLSGTEEDVVHDAWQAIVAMEPRSIENLEAMAVSVTWRKAVDVCRRTLPPGSLGQVLPLPSCEDTYFQALDEIRCRELAKELLDQILDERERRLFVACQLKARTRVAVAEEEGITPQRVGQIVAMAARKLHRAAMSRIL